ncbi:MAG TPA: immunoglobulin domain-containing protein, partial [Planctomycetota bacterium]|nr:immunoglobulin domain-containing protein [Planctomycetota bacterium]
GAPTFTAQPTATQTVFEGATVTLTVAAAGGAPLFHQWGLNGVPIPGATSPTLTLTNVTYADDGTYACAVSNSCGLAVSAAAKVVVHSCTLVLGPTGQPRGVRVQNFSNHPFAHYFVAVSFNTNNITMPGQGNFGGLFIPYADVFLQFNTMQLPFVGQLDAFGDSFWQTPPNEGLLPGVIIHAVTHLFDPLQPYPPIGRSNVSTFTVL